MIVEVRIADVVDLGIEDGNHFFRTHDVDLISEVGNLVKVLISSRGLDQRRQNWSLEKTVDVQRQVLKRLRKLTRSLLDSRILCDSCLSSAYVLQLEQNL